MASWIDGSIDGWMDGWMQCNACEMCRQQLTYDMFTASGEFPV